MTGRLRRHDFGRGHAYVLDCDCPRYTKDDPHKLPSVTGVLGALSAPGLIAWAQRTVAEAAVNQWDDLARLPVTDRLAKLRKAADAARDSAALRGTQIHDLGESLVHGQPVDVPDQHRGPVEAYARFLDRWKIEPVATETPLYATRFGGYAGTADLWATVGVRDGERALVDLKTGKGVYSTVALQLAAYRSAEFWQPDGRDSEQPLPPVDAVYVAHVLPDDVRLLPVVAGEREARAFDYLATVFRWQQRHDGYPTPAEPLIGEAVTA